MTFSSALDQAWNDHATKPEAVTSDLKTMLPLVESPDQLMQMTALATHVFGEHLGQWARGLEFLCDLRRHAQFKNDHEISAAIARSLVVLEIGAGQATDLSSFSTSDQIRILAVATSAVSPYDVPKSTRLFHRALSLANSLGERDPANRALAITGNNLACTLEEKTSRTSEDRELMILAAQTARKYWQRAGGWLEVAIAEYRLAMTFIQAGDANRALEHAQINIEMCRENNGGDRNLFYGYEALALAEKQRGNKIGFEAAVALAKERFAKLDDGDKADLANTLARLSS